MTQGWNPLRSVAPYPPARQGALADRIGGMLSSSGSTFLVPGEAIVALEAVARGLGRPGLRALNVVTSPYGHLFGQWLAQTGTEVLDVVAEAGQPIEVDRVQEALATSAPVDVVVLVHGEAASGIVNPLAEIAALARRSGAIVVVDAVASVGAHVLDADDQGLDVVIVGPQKGLGGPASLSAVTVSSRAASLLHRDGVPSSAALPDASGRVPLVTTDPLSFWALEAALDAVDDEGLAALIERHGRAARATRAAVRALGAGLWVPDDARASHLVTAAAVPAGVDATDLLRHIVALDPVGVSAGVGTAGHRFIRLNHTGLRANFEPVLATVAAFGHGLAAVGTEVDLGAAARAVLAVFATP